MTVLGADVEALDVLARSCREHAETFRRADRTITAGLTIAWWRGDDAAEFRDDWRSRHQVVIRRLGERLDDLAEQLRRQAEQQRAASEAAGAILSGGGGFGSAWRTVRATRRDRGGRAPADAAASWDGLTPEQQQALIEDQPEYVSSTDGFPMWARDAASRSMMAEELARLENLPVTHPDFDQDQIDLYRWLLGEGPPPDSLTDTPRPDLIIGFDPTATEPQMILAYGDPTTADVVTTYVPGISSDHHPDHVLADTYQLDQVAHSQGEPGTDYATIMWLGYDTPDTEFVAQPGFNPETGPQFLQDTDVMPGIGPGEAGAPDLAGFIDGLGVINDDAWQNVAAHSYGTVLTSIAGDEFGLSADNVVLIGSPGIPISTLDWASDAEVDVFVNDEDLLATPVIVVDMPNPIPDLAIVSPNLPGAHRPIDLVDVDVHDGEGGHGIDDYVDAPADQEAMGEALNPS